MKTAGLFLLSLLLTGCAMVPKETPPESGCLLVEAAINPPLPSQSAPLQAMKQRKPYRVDLPNYGPAPELNNQVWLNTGQPLRMADLRGKVVLIEMWTFGCINCQQVIPSLREWHQKYASQGLVIIGNHYPEFGYEKDLDNLKDAIQRLDIPYLVTQDNDGATWRAYHNRYWPALFLIDKRGDIRYRHIGEGVYAETEVAIQSLLVEIYP